MSLYKIDNTASDVYGYHHLIDAITGAYCGVKRMNISENLDLTNKIFKLKFDSNGYDGYDPIIATGIEIFRYRKDCQR